MDAGKTKKGVIADDIFNSVSTPNNKRPRASVGTGGSGASGALPATPTSSSSRPTHQGPSRLQQLSSPTVNGSLTSSSPVASTSSSPSSAVPFNLRPDAGKVLETLNKHLTPVRGSIGDTGRPRVLLSSTRNPKDYEYRYQFEKLMQRSEVLDSTIDEAAESLRQAYGIEEFSDPLAQSQEDVVVAGRLCPESDAVKMSETTTWFETSRTLGSGSRVLLKFEKPETLQGGALGAAGVGMFPGCLVGLVGRNGGGKVFTVNKILTLPPIDASYTRPSEILSNQYGTSDKQLGGASMGVVVAAGPYTLDSDLRYAPFAALIDRVTKDKPDILVLLGPFVDADHPLVKRGDLDQLPGDIFIERISNPLRSLIEKSPRTTVLLVPNGRDMTSSHLAYPQSPFSKEQQKELKLPKGVRCVPNPTTFSINEVVFAASSVDVIFHLRNQEFFKRCDTPVADGSEEDPNAKNVLARACRHLLRQRSFYPLFPAPLPNAGIDPLNLDITHNDLVKMGYSGADIIILPSRLTHFVKVVDSTIMLNPTFLTRGNSAGLYAKLTINPSDKGELERYMSERDDEPVEHRLWERCKVELIKI